MYCVPQRLQHEGTVTGSRNLKIAGWNRIMKAPGYKDLRRWGFLRSFTPMKGFPMVSVLGPGQWQKGGSMMRCHSGRHNVSERDFLAEAVSDMLEA